MVVVVKFWNRSMSPIARFSMLSLRLSLFLTPHDPSSNSKKQVFTPEDEAAVVSSLQALDLSAM